MKTLKILILFLFLCITLGGCAASKMSVSRNSNAIPQEINKIALMPSGGPIADAIGIELLNYGYDIIDTTAVTGYMARYNLNEMELALPQNISKLSDKDIDTILIVKGVAGYDGKPESVSAKLVSTTNGKLIVGVTWQNGKGGAQGSPADSMMRSNLSEAAKTIAEGLGSSLK